MHCNMLDADIYIQHHLAELRREADMVRLVDLAAGERVSVRRRVAEWLVSIAERLDDRSAAYAGTLGRAAS